MLSVANLSSSLPLWCKPSAPYDSIQAAIGALKGLTLSQIEVQLRRYNWSKLFPSELQQDRLWTLQEIPLPPKKSELSSPPFWQSLIPNFRMRDIASLVTFVAICILRTTMIDIKNPPRNSWDAARQLELMLNAAAKFIEYSKSIRDYFSTPLRGYLAIGGAVLAIKFLHAFLSHITQRALPKQNSARNLSEEAKEGKLRHAAILGRGQELQDMKCALNSGSNVFLLGPTGSGKTALVEALTLAIEKGEVDTVLKGKTVLLANAAELVGNTYQFDQEADIARPPLDALIASMQGKEDRYILFIDEIHAAIGQEGCSSADLIQVLKSKIDGTRFPTVIIATTDIEYQKSLVGDIAFERRFVKISLNELSIEVVKLLLIQEYAHLFEKGSDIDSAIDLFDLRDRTVAFPSCILQLFKLVASSLATFKNQKLTQALEAKRQELESQRAHLLIEGQINISAIKSLRDEIQGLEQQLESQRTLFEELWAIQGRMLDLLRESIHLAKAPIPPKYDILLRENLFRPALEAKYTEKKVEYKHISNMDFVDKASLTMIRSVFEAHKPSLLGISSIGTLPLTIDTKGRL